MNMMKLNHPNTFAAKEQIKALGGKWNTTDKCWMVPSGKINEAHQACRDAKPITYNRRGNYCQQCRQLGRKCSQCMYDDL